MPLASLSPSCRVHTSDLHTLVSVCTPPAVFKFVQDLCLGVRVDAMMRRIHADCDFVTL
jgi:hypothetical protein